MNQQQLDRLNQQIRDSIIEDHEISMEGIDFHKLAKVAGAVSIIGIILALIARVFGGSSGGGGGGGSGTSVVEQAKAVEQRAEESNARSEAIIREAAPVVIAAYDARHAQDDERAERAAVIREAASEAPRADVELTTPNPYVQEYAEFHAETLEMEKQFVIAYADTRRHFNLGRGDSKFNEQPVIDKSHGDYNKLFTEVLKDLEHSINHYNDPWTHCGHSALLREVFLWNELIYEVVTSHMAALLKILTDVISDCIGQLLKDGDIDGLEDGSWWKVRTEAIIGCLHGMVGGLEEGEDLDEDLASFKAAFAAQDVNDEVVQRKFALPIQALIRGADVATPESPTSPRARAEVFSALHLGVKDLNSGLCQLEETLKDVTENNEHEHTRNRVLIGIINNDLLRYTKEVIVLLSGLELSTNSLINAINNAVHHTNASWSKIEKAQHTLQRLKQRRIREDELYARATGTPSTESYCRAIRGF